MEDEGWVLFGRRSQQRTLLSSSLTPMSTKSGRNKWMPKDASSHSVSDEEITEDSFTEGSQSRALWWGVGGVGDENAMGEMESWMFQPTMGS